MFLRPLRTPRTALGAAIVLGLSLAASAARAEIIDLQFDAQGRFDRSVQVAPGKFVELCGKLPAGAKVQWRYEGAAPLDFNIHYHVGKDVKFPAKAEAKKTGDGVLAADSEQDYCWMWSNKQGAPAALTVTLSRS